MGFFLKVSLFFFNHAVNRVRSVLQRRSSASIYNGGGLF
jgi:hypothetical protein